MSTETTNHLDENNEIISPKSEKTTLLVLLIVFAEILLMSFYFVTY